MLTIKTIRNRLIFSVKEKFPHLTEDQIDAVVDQYFTHFKLRVKSFDKLEFRLLNIGTISTKRTTLIRRYDRLQEKLKKYDDEKTRSKIESDLRLLTPALSIIEDLSKNGKTIKKRNKLIKQGKLQT